MQCRYSTKAPVVPWSCFLNDRVRQVPLPDRRSIGNALITIFAGIAPSPEKNLSFLLGIHLASSGLGATLSASAAPSLSH